MFNYFNKNNRIYPINNTIDHYTTIHKLDYKRYNLWNYKKDVYKRQQKVCERLFYGGKRELQQ